MRRGVLLIWLCVALLPLRGMAHAVMLGSGALHGPAAVQSAGDASTPCPMHAGSPASVAVAPDAGAPSPQDPASPAGSGCHLCAVCHGVAMPAMAFAAFDAETPRSAPQAGHGLGAGRDAPDGLYRPPR
jgi:hypothetical protein